MEVKRQSAEMTAGIEDTFAGIRVVKAFTNEAYQKERFDALCDRYAEARKKTYGYMANFVSNTHFFTSVLNLAVIFVGGYLIYLDKMSVGVLVEFLMFVNIFVQPVRRFTSLVEDFQKAKTGYKRCREILHLEAEINDARPTRWWPIRSKVKLRFETSASHTAKTCRCLSIFRSASGRAKRSPSSGRPARARRR
jgi:ATP-binding cassette subfamily B protein